MSNSDKKLPTHINVVRAGILLCLSVTGRNSLWCRRELKLNGGKPTGVGTVLAFIDCVSAREAITKVIKRTTGKDVDFPAPEVQQANPGELF